MITVIRQIKGGSSTMKSNCRVFISHSCCKGMNIVMIMLDVALASLFLGKFGENEMFLIIIKFA